MAPSRTEDLRLAAYLALATAAQLAFWAWSTPGPRLLGGEGLGLEAGLRWVALSVATLLVAAVLAVPLLRRPASSLGLGWGRSGRGLVWAAAGALVAAPVLWLQGGDPAFRASYPWVSASWLQADPARWALWIPAYAAYYLAFEAFYRGAVLHALRPRLGDPAANVLQASLATLIHVGKPWAETVAAWPASLIFGVLTLRFRSVVPAVLLHLAIGLTLDAAIVARGGP